jgi:hypothetical protein
LFSRCIHVAGQKRTNPWSALAAVSDDDDGKNDGLKWILSASGILFYRCSATVIFKFLHKAQREHPFLIIHIHSWFISLGRYGTYNFCFNHVLGEHALFQLFLSLSKAD